MGTHPCPKDGCPVQVERDMFACRSHWFAITAGTRRRIWRTWQGGDIRAHMDAMIAGRAELNSK